MYPIAVTPMMVSAGAIATALDTLSSFTAVGVRESQDLFLEELAHLLGTNAASLPAMPQFAATGELAARLRRLPEEELLIEQDLEIYHHVKSALQNAMAKSGAAEIS
jgi:hypothetical protein